MMTFEDKLHQYARVGLLYGLGMDQKIRPLFVDGFQIENQANFYSILAEEAYRIGVKTVDVLLRDPKLERAQFIYAPEKHKLHVPKHVSTRAQEIVDCDGARIAINGNGGIGIMDDVDSKYPATYKAVYFKATEPFFTRRMKMLQPWSILNVPTVAWANEIGG